MTYAKMNFSRHKKQIENKKTHSAWEKGVITYASELFENVKENYTPEDVCNVKLLEKALLNGASDWAEFSWGGCSLIYNGDIAERLCTASELKRTHNGERRPNAKEEWLDVQARALYQAAQLVKQAARMCAFIDENGEPLPWF